MGFHPSNIPVRSGMDISISLGTRWYLMACSMRETENLDWNWRPVFWKKRSARLSLLFSFSCLNLLENNCWCRCCPCSGKNIVAWLLPCAFYLCTGVQKQLLCVMITVLQMKRLCNGKINSLTGMCADSEKSEMGQPDRCADLKTIEKSIWGADLLRYVKFPPNSSRVWSI